MLEHQKRVQEFKTAVASVIAELDATENPSLGSHFTLAAAALDLIRSDPGACEVTKAAADEALTSIEEALIRTRARGKKRRAV